MRKDSMRTFDNIDKIKVEAILKALKDNGSVVTGNNPWHVDTKNHGVLLQGMWNNETSELTITVLDADWYVPRTKIWENIDSLMRIVQEAA